MQRCREATDGAWAPTTVQGGVYFAVNGGGVVGGGSTDFPFHMDHDSVFLPQSHRNNVNLYIYVTKPDPARSGLTLVPASAIRAALPDLWPRLEFGGAKMFGVTPAGRPAIRDDCTGGPSEFHVLPVHLETLAQTPRLRAGDALLFRMDLFHRTQASHINLASDTFRDGAGASGFTAVRHCCGRRCFVLDPLTHCRSVRAGHGDSAGGAFVSAGG